MSRIGLAAGRDGGRLDHGLELQLEPVPPADLGLGLLQLVAGRIEHDRAALAVEQHHHARRDRGQRADRAHHGRDAQRVGQDGGVRRPGALLADEPDDVLAVELHGQPGRELVRDDDDLLVRGHRPELVGPCRP